jgi:predicted ribosomally synthesized peptide with SipW-like signal peptide
MTTDTNFTLSRRKVLAGLGTVGIASAGAGLGTTAFFSDEEAVGASLEAGRLDLKLDYRATYNTWLPLERTKELVDGPVVPDPDAEYNYLVGQAPDIRAADGSAITGTEWAEFTRAADACVVDDASSLTAEVDRVGQTLGMDYTTRVTGDDDYLGPEDQIYVDGEPGVKFELLDVKPKDEGEATISVHLCGNPAYLWMRANRDAADENGIVEPETEAGDVTETGELANYIYARLWDDRNCNNRPDSGKVDVAVVFDRSCSMEFQNPFSTCGTAPDQAPAPEKLPAAQTAAKNLYDSLLSEAADAQVAFVSYNNTATLDLPLTPVTGANQAAYDTAVDDVEDDLGGGTDIADGIAVATNVLNGNTDETTDNVIDYSGNSPRADAEKVMIVLTDGFPRDPSLGSTEADIRQNSAQTTRDAATAARMDDITVYTVTYQFSAYPIPDAVALMGAGANGIASSSSTALVANFDALGDLTSESTSAINAAFEEIAVVLAGGDEFLYQGSLAGLLELASSGIPLDSARVETGEAGACFPGGVYCFAFDWYFVCEPEDFDLPSDVDGVETLGEELDALKLPLDVNVAQTDSEVFSLDFAAIQCRHNMENANPFTGEVAQAD